MRGRPSSGHSLLRNLEERLRLQGVVEGLVRSQHYIFGGGQCIRILSLILELGRGDQIGGASEVGDELTERYSRARMFEQARCGE